MAETLQRIYDACAYGMLAHGTTPTDKKFNASRARAVGHLLHDLQSIADHASSEEMATLLDEVARMYGLESRL